METLVTIFVKLFPAVQLKTEGVRKTFEFPMPDRIANLALAYDTGVHIDSGGLQLSPEG
jgi:hypothetical protein